jgi:hydroxymethylglutaryl-CoA lyase
MNEAVQIVDVSARDGLQKESTVIPLSGKLRLLQQLGGAGYRVIELTKIRSAKFKQFEDARSLIEQVPRLPGVRYPVLVSEDEGADEALSLGATDIGLWVGTTDGFNRKSLNLNLEEALAWACRLIGRLKSGGCWVRAYVSAAFGCPVEGVVPAEVTARAARAFAEAGADQICLADTAAAATPGDVRRLVQLVREEVQLERISLHLHNTRGSALANALTGYAEGVRTFDGSAGGIGGENLPSEELAVALASVGVETGIDVDATCEAARTLATLGAKLSGRYVRAGAFFRPVIGNG